MNEEEWRRIVLVCLCLIVAVSAWFRLSGIGWALESGYGHYLNYQPDEFISMRGMLPIQLLEGKLKAPEAYFEGTFNYYLWAVPEMFYRICRGAPAIVGENVPLEQFKFILLSGRLMAVAFDLAALLFIYAIIVALTGSSGPALFGAFLYGIMPMQVIYSHFMRTHLLSNLLCVMVLWLSLKAIKHRRWWLYCAAGLVAGLGGAARYPVAVILSIPFFLMLFSVNEKGEGGFRHFGRTLRSLLSGPIWFLAGGFILGLFVGAPMLFVDPRTVLYRISTETLHYVPAGATKVFDLEPLWQYFSVLMPYAAYPFLWLLIYLATLFVVVRRSLWQVVLPLCLFAALYTYPMSKGYIVIFARQVMLLLPIFCIFVGLAGKEIFKNVRSRPFLSAGLGVVMAVLILPTLLFDWAYGKAMQGRDVRDAVRQDLSALVKTSSPVTIGVSDSGCYFYTAMPGVFPLKSQRVDVRLQESAATPADFFVMGFERPLAPNWRDFAIKQVESKGVFRFMKEYNRAPAFFGRRVDLSNFPPDMTYPFPTILLFRKSID